MKKQRGITTFSKYAGALTAAMMLGIVLAGCGSKTEAAAETPAATEAPAEAPAATEAATEAVSETPAPTESVVETTAAETVEETAAETTEETAEETAAETETEAKKEFTPEGEYQSFAVLHEGFTVSSEELGLDSRLVLTEDGGGTMYDGDDSMGVKQWSLSGTDFEITLEDEGVADGVLKDGILELDVMGDGSTIIYYMQEGADISSYSFVSMEEVKKQLDASNAAE